MAGLSREVSLRHPQENKIGEQALHFIFLAGMAGIEPANDGTKTRCLTTWRHPSVPQLYHKNTKKPPKQMSLGGL